MHSGMVWLCDTCGLRQAAAQGCMRCARRMHPELVDMRVPRALQDAFTTLRRRRLGAAKELYRRAPSARKALFGYGVGVGLALGLPALPLLGTPAFLPIYLPFAAAVASAGGLVGGALHRWAPRTLVGRDDKLRIDEEVRALIDAGAMPLELAPSEAPAGQGVVTIRGVARASTHAPLLLGEKESEPVIAWCVSGSAPSGPFAAAQARPFSLETQDEIVPVETPADVIVIAPLEDPYERVLESAGREFLDARGAQCQWGPAILATGVIRDGDEVEVCATLELRTRADGYRSTESSRALGGALVRIERVVESAQSGTQALP